jgi:hypothetical protein
MLEEAGYSIYDLDVVYRMRAIGLVSRCRRLESFLKTHLRELIAYQYVFRAGKVPRPDATPRAAVPEDDADQ